MDLRVIAFLSLASPNLIGDTNLLTVLVRDYGSARCPRVCAKHDAILEEAAYDGGPCACRVWERNTLLLKERVSDTIREIKAGTIVYPAHRRRGQGRTRRVTLIWPPNVGARHRMEYGFYLSHEYA